ncbi:type II toxin-antitoxin system Phd/YefM family antitoxin [Streptomyces sp. JJ66]|uniref:type II toxin-antitoxin system Phd/YefM family antitoxin n=1 Tax=Streptomyces sp. JJ66 TaxID=2803843 RepID=UPI001C571413|nr:type II toxin-antitoxin system prevent-host-death family antitoxin [Streptomyces sp. JJ66]MBW1603720.1 type II toxin-antitoxin system Phd/YefM family antitoxin [Streptomyces sp. JJ66]
MEELREPVREARAHFGDVIDRALRDETTVITRNGKEVAAVVSMDSFRKFRLLEDEADRRAIADSVDEPTYSFEEVLRETLERPE